MSLVQLKQSILEDVRAVVKDPTAALPIALKALAPETDWDLLTQKVGSTQVKAGAAELALPLFDKSLADDGALSSTWKWTGSLQAKAALEIDLLADDDLKALPLRPDDGHTLVSYGASIAFGGKLGLNGSIPAWSATVGVAGSAQRAAAVHWYVQAKNDATLLDALIDAAGNFIWPHDLQAMRRLANRKDWYGLDMSLDGDAQFEVQVDASKQGTGFSFALNGEKVGVGLSFGLSAGFKAARQSRWKLSVMVDKRPATSGASGPLGLRVKLTDLHKSQQDTTVAFSAGADFSAITASAERALRAAWPELDSPLLDALAQPGTAVKARLAKLIDSRLEGPLAGLVTVLVGGKAPDSLRSDLVDRLTGGLADVLDRALGKLSQGQADATALVGDWLGRVLGPAAAFVDIDEQLEGLVTEALTTVTDGLQNAIGKLKDAIVGQAQHAVDAVLKRLGELGAQFDEGLDQLDENKASAAIRKALRKYADFREKLLGMLTNSQRQKVMLTLAAEWRRETSSEAVFEAWFRADDDMTPEAERLFHALCGGRLLALPELVKAAKQVKAIEDEKGSFLATVNALSEQRLSLNFFGIEIGNSTSWLAKVDVRTDLVTGDLIAATAAASSETAIFNPWKNRTARLGVKLELRHADAGPTFGASLDGAFTAISEKSANAETVQQLLNAYFDAVGARRVDVGRVLDAPSKAIDKAAAKKFWKALTLAIPVVLDETQWGRFAAVDETFAEDVSLQVALPMFQRRYVGDSLFSSDPLGDLRDQVEAMFSLKKASDDDLLRYLRLFPDLPVHGDAATSAAVGLKIGATFSSSFDRGTRRFLAWHRLSSTVQAPLRLRRLAAQASARLQSFATPVDPVAARNALEPLMRQMQVALAPVALVSETWLGTGVGSADDEPVSWPFVAFITTMAKLAGVPVPPGFVPIASPTDRPAVLLIA